MSDLRFHPNSGITDLEPDVEYAGVYVWRPTYEPYAGVMRPVHVVYNALTPETPTVFDPVESPDRSRFVGDDDHVDLMILGLWEEKVFSAIGVDTSMTWRGYAAQQLGQVLRQRELAQRLTDFGIAREPEEYLPHLNIANAVARSLVLNFEEIERLLDAAGV